MVPVSILQCEKDRCVCVRLSKRQKLCVSVCVWVWVYVCVREKVHFNLDVELPLVKALFRMCCFAEGSLWFHWVYGNHIVWTDLNFCLMCCSKRFCLVPGVTSLKSQGHGSPSGCHVCMHMNHKSFAGSCLFCMCFQCSFHLTSVQVHQYSTSFSQW